MGGPLSTAGNWHFLPHPEAWPREQVQVLAVYPVLPLLVVRFGREQ